MPEVSLPITTLLTCCLLAWLLVLSWRVIKVRQSGVASLGDGGDEKLQRRIRAQANLTEYAPLFVVLIAILELQNANPIVLMVIAFVFLAGRLVHGYALSFTSGNTAGRVGGMGLTIAGSAFAVIYGIITILI